jgi:hypothetical protein
VLVNLAIDSARTLSHYHDSIAHVNAFIDIMGNQKHRAAAIFPKPQDFVLHAHTREGIERAERFVEQEDFRVIDERAGESDALGHAPRKMMWIGIRKSLESDEPHEFVHFVLFFAQYAACNETGLDIAADSEPRKEIWILKKRDRVPHSAR